MSTTNFEIPHLGPKRAEKPEKINTFENAGKRFIDNIIFTETVKRDGTKEYRNSSMGRKIMILGKDSRIPEPRVSYRVKVIEETKPENPLEGKMIVEITLSEEEERVVSAIASEAYRLFEEDDLGGTLEYLKKLKEKIFQ